MVTVNEEPECPECRAEVIATDYGLACLWCDWFERDGELSALEVQEVRNKVRDVHHRRRREVHNNRVKRIYWITSKEDKE